MSQPKFTLSSYEPVYVTAPEVKIEESAIRAQAKRWLEVNVCKDGEKPQLEDTWIKEHIKEDSIKNVDDFLVFIRYNMYRDNREVQKLADQNIICKELATRLEQELPKDLVEEAKYAAHMRLEDMLRRSGLLVKDYCKQKGISEKQLYNDVETSAIQSLREDSALEAYANEKNYTLEPEDFYAIIPGESVEEKAYKRRQIEMDGRLPGMESYAKKVKALNEVMDNAMIRRADNLEYVRYGDVSSNIMDAYNENPESFINL